MARIGFKKIFFVPKITKYIACGSIFPTSLYSRREKKNHLVWAWIKPRPSHYTSNRSYHLTMLPRDTLHVICDKTVINYLLNCWEIKDDWDKPLEWDVTVLEINNFDVLGVQVFDQNFQRRSVSWTPPSRSSASNSFGSEATPNPVQRQDDYWPTDRWSNHPL